MAVKRLPAGWRQTMADTYEVTPMAIDMEEVIGPENMKPEAKETVMDLLRSLPFEFAAEAKHAFFSWAKETGYEPTAQDAHAMGTRKKRRPT